MKLQLKLFLFCFLSKHVTWQMYCKFLTCEREDSLLRSSLVLIPQSEHAQLYTRPFTFLFLQHLQLLELQAHIYYMHSSHINQYEHQFRAVILHYVRIVIFFHKRIHAFIIVQFQYILLIKKTLCVQVTFHDKHGNIQFIFSQHQRSDYKGLCLLTGRIQKYKKDSGAIWQ